MTTFTPNLHSTVSARTPRVNSSRLPSMQNRHDGYKGGLDASRYLLEGIAWRNPVRT